MKNIVSIILLAIIVVSCKDEQEISSMDYENWEKRTVLNKLNDSHKSGTSYLSVYSQIYSMTEHRTFNLTATISLRNTNIKDTVYIKKAEYFNTKGDLVRSYINKPIFLCPLETVSIVIDEIDDEGGVGANFLFDWSIKKTSNEPFFEGIMISTSGAQGTSITTQGFKLKN